MDSDEARGSLVEIRDLRSIILRVGRSSVVDASGSDDAVVAEALKADERGSRRHRSAYRVIAKKLNDYIRKHESMTAATGAEEADFIIYFNLLEYRRLLDRMYPYGELVIILNRKSGGASPPRVVWKSKVMWAEDAAKEFIKQLKRVRGEG